MLSLIKLRGYEVSMEVEQVCADLAEALQADLIDGLTPEMQTNAAELLADSKRSVIRSFSANTFRLKKDGDAQEFREATGWLRSAGFAEFVELFNKNLVVSEEEMLRYRRSLKDDQYMALQKRVNALNRTLIARKSSAEGSLKARSNNVNEEVTSDSDSQLSPTISATRPLSNNSDSVSSGTSPAPERLRSSFDSLAVSSDQRPSFEHSTSFGSEYESILAPGDLDIEMTLDDLVKSCEAAPPINIFDLTPADAARLRPFAVLELTALMEHNIGRMPVGRKRSVRTDRGRKNAAAVSRSKSAKKVPEITQLFGSPLTAIANYDAEDRPTPPDFLIRAIRYLEQEIKQEGLFRKVGSAARVRALKEHCDERMGVVDFTAVDARPHDVATLLKQLFREAPEPLLSSKYSETFAATQGLPDDATQISALCLLMLVIPDAHAVILKELLTFLYNVSQHSEENKMSILNLAVIFAPNVFLFKESKADQAKARDIQAVMSAAFRCMIENHDKLWTVPPAVIAQLRHSQVNAKGKESKEKAKEGIKNRLRKRPVEVDPKRIQQKESLGAWDAQNKTQYFAAEGDSPERALLRVEIPFSIDMRFKAQLISSESVASDVVVKTLKHLNGIYDPSVYALYIKSSTGERCLPATEPVLPLVKRNREAFFQIRVKPGN